MNTLTPTSARPLLYGQLADAFRERILSGELKPGERLPSFTEMRQRHRVSQATLNRVHGLLEAEGLISRRRGAGTFVCDSQGQPVSDGANGAAPVSFLSNAIVILTPFGKPSAAHRSGGWLEWIAQGASDAVQGTGMHAVSLNPQITDVEIERLVAEKPFGALIPAALSESATPLHLMRELRSRGIATVAFGSSSELAECDHVLSDHRNGAYQLTRHLLERGKRRIVNVQILGDNEVWLQERQAGYERAMREASLEAEPPFLIPSMKTLLSVQLAGEESATEEMRQEMRQEFESPEKILAEDRRIFDSDVRALAGYFVEALGGKHPVEGMLTTTDRSIFVLAAICRLFGKNPNHDVLIAGYDNYFADCEEFRVAPFVPAATVDKNNRALGEAMVQLLFDRINGKLPDTPQTRIIEPRLIVTGS